MHAHAIDTLEAANSLKEAGVSAKQAEAIVKVYDSAARLDKETFATKADLANTEERLKADMTVIKADIERVETSLKADMTVIKADMTVIKADIERVETTLKSELKSEIATSKLHIIVALGGLMALFKAFDYFLVP